MEKLEGGVYKKNPNIVSRIIDNDTILVPIARQVEEVECIYTLNESGTYIWNKLDGKTTLEQIATELTKEYSIPNDKAEKDIKSLINDLEKADCIKAVR